MSSKIKTRPVTEQSEQATAYVADESVGNSLMAQESDAPVSNCAAQDSQESVEGMSKPTASMEQSESETLKAKVKAELNAGNPVPYEDFLSAGLSSAYTEGNRGISKAHVKTLVASLKRTGKLLTDITMCNSKTLLEEGSVLRDGDGNKLSLDTEGIDDYYAIIDGQHRWDALKQYFSDDSTKGQPLSACVRLVPIPNNVSARTLVAEYNITVKKWTGKNTRHYAECLISKDDTVMQRMADCVDKDKMSLRCAWKTYKMVDGYRKEKYEKAILEGEMTDELRGTQAEIERGDSIRRAMQVCCRNEPKMKRNSAIIDFIIAVYNSVADTDKAETMNLLLLFLTSLPEGKIKSAMEKDSVEKKSEFFKAEWTVFREEAKTEENMRRFEELAERAESEYEAMAASETSDKVKARKSRARKSSQTK